MPLFDDPMTTPPAGPPAVHWVTPGERRERRRARAARNAEAIAQIPLTFRVVVGLAVAGAALQLGTALLMLAGLVGGSCDICGGMPGAGAAIAVVVALGEVFAFRAIWTLVRPGFRLTPMVIGGAVAGAQLLRWAWPW